ncbi:hypothetical protein BDZ91DRAFT_756440, partial [Kalaharituber pfeilii]
MRSKEIFEEQTRMQAETEAWDTWMEEINDWMLTEPRHPKLIQGPGKNKEHWAKYCEEFVKEFPEKFQYVKAVGDLTRGEIAVALARWILTQRARIWRVKSTQKTLEKRVMSAKANRSRRVARAGPYAKIMQKRLIVNL